MAVLLTTYIFFVTFALFVAVLFTNKKSGKKDLMYQGKTAPGPRQWPIIGSIPYVAKYRDICDAFTAMRKEYGDVAAIKLGCMNAMVFSGVKHLRQILSEKSHLFDSRPNFTRYNLIFGGDKNNSLAFADWTSTHAKTRNVIMNHTFARTASAPFENLVKISTDRIQTFMNKLETSTKTQTVQNLKPELNQLLGAIFVQYFFNVDVIPEENEAFRKMVTGFEDIFEEVNEECVGDIFPALMPFIDKSWVHKSTEDVRHFLVSQCVEPRLAARASKVDANNNEPKKGDEETTGDLLDSFLDYIESNEGMTLDKALYCLEDIAGGHSAISNFILRALCFLAKEPQVQAEIRAEVSRNTHGIATITDKLPYTEAAVWEMTRFISSPIVPHVATEDTTIDDFAVKKGTVIFINNRDLNFSEECWNEPQKFMPERFLVDGFVKKPEHFLPFSTGSRHCLGYKMTLWLTTVIVANLCSNYEITLDANENYDLPRNRLDIGSKSLKFVYTPISY